jgi:hypothetical protein
MPDTSTLVLQALVTLASGGTGAAIIGGIVSHRSTRAAVNKTVAETGKTEAEIVGVGTSAAAAQVDTAMDMLREVRIDMSAMRTELASLQQWKTRHERLMEAHIRWDAQVFQILRDRGVQIEPPPPLRAD